MLVCIHINDMMKKPNHTRKKGKRTPIQDDQQSVGVHFVCFQCPLGVHSCCLYIQHRAIAKTPQEGGPVHQKLGMILMHKKYRYHNSQLIHNLLFLCWYLPNSDPLGSCNVSCKAWHQQSTYGHHCTSHAAPGLECWQTWCGTWQGGSKFTNWCVSFAILPPSHFDSHIPKAEKMSQHVTSIPSGEYHPYLLNWGSILTYICSLLTMAPNLQHGLTIWSWSNIFGTPICGYPCQWVLQGRTEWR